MPDPKSVKRLYVNKDLYALVKEYVGDKKGDMKIFTEECIFDKLTNDSFEDARLKNLISRFEKERIENG